MITVLCVRTDRLSCINIRVIIIIWLLTSNKERISSVASIKLFNSLKRKKMDIFAAKACLINPSHKVDFTEFQEKQNH